MILSRYRYRPVTVPLPLQRYRDPSSATVTEHYWPLRTVPQRYRTLQALPSVTERYPALLSVTERYLDQIFHSTPFLLLSKNSRTVLSLAFL